MATKSPATREHELTVEGQPKGNLPSSGFLLGVLVEVFDLRCESKYLRGSTAQRCFKGATVSAQSKSRIIREVALNLQATVGDQKKMGSVDVLRSAVATWDGARHTASSLSKLLEGSGGPWAIPVLIIRGFVAKGVDACLAPVDEQSCPTVRVDGIGSLLRRWQEAGQPRISRDEISEGLGCSPNTVDAWLDSGALPKPESLRALARFFGKRLGRAERRLEIALRYRRACARFARWLRQGSRRRPTEADVRVGDHRPSQAWAATKNESSTTRAP